MKLESNNLFLSSNEIGSFLTKICEKGIPFKFTAKGTSMSPFICDGDSLIIEPFIKDINPEIGDVVAFISPEDGHLIIHRVIKKQDRQYLLKGDNVYSCDGYCGKNNLHGYVKEVIIMGKDLLVLTLFIRRFFQFLSNFKKIIAFFSRYKLLTPCCRLINRLMRQADINRVI